LVERSPHHPLVVRALAVRTLLHSIAADLWPGDVWPPLLADALRALATGGGQPRDEEQTAAGSLAAIGLGVLCTTVRRMSWRDERQLRYTAAAAAVAEGLVHRDAEQIERPAVRR
jgi:hypothetical protein